MSNRQILMVGPGYEGGGAERHFCKLCSIYKDTSDCTVLTKFRSESNVTMKSIRPKNHINSNMAIWNTITGKYRVVMTFGWFPSVCGYILSNKRCYLISTEFTLLRSSIMYDTRRYKHVIYRIMQHVYAHSDHVVVNSKSGYDELIGSGINDEHVSIIYNIVENNYIESEDVYISTVDKFGPYIACCGRMDENKRPLLLLDSFRLIADKIPHNLVFIGDGLLSVEIRRKAVEYGLSSRVHLTGWLQEPRSIIANAALLCHMSLIEGFPNVVAEAFESGVPVVSTQWGRDVLDLNTQNCLLMCEDNVYSMSNQIIRGLFNRDLRSSLVKNAKIFVSEMSGIRIREKYDSVIDSVVGIRRK